MMAISRFIFKVLRKSILFYISLFIVNIFFFLNLTYIHNNNASFVQYYLMQGFGQFGITIIIVLTSLFYISKNYEVVKLLCKNDFEYFMGLGLAMMKFSFLVSSCIFPYLIYYNLFIKLMDLNSFKNVLIIFICEWTLPLILVSLIMILISLNIKNKILKYLISIIITYATSMNILTFGLTDNKWLKTLIKSLSLFNDKVFTVYSSTIGPIYDFTYILDKIILIITIMFIILLAYLRYKCRFKYTTYMLITSIYMISISLTNICIYLNIDYIGDENIYLNSSNSINLSVSSYDMTLNLNNGIQNNCNLTILNSSNKEINQFNFNLDSKFNIKSIKINGANIKFDRKNNEVLVKLNQPFLPNKNLTCSIEYLGKLNVYSYWDEYMYLATENYTILPENTIAWYPKLIESKQNEYKFNLNINSNRKIYTNLNSADSINKYTGIRNDVCIYSGMYKEYMYKGITIVASKEFDNKYLENYINGIELSDKDVLTSINKVIFGRINLNLYDDLYYKSGNTLIINNY